jgi:phosphomevalonate kinase
LKIPKFNHTQSKIGDVKKTGLGSSAAMTSSLVSAILLHFGTIDIHSINGIKIAHNVAQASHCFAQGKIGSGFDVCSAIFGTHAYQRFSPAFLNSIFENDTLHSCMTDSIYDSLNQR